MLSVFADCHRCLNSSMSSKNLRIHQSINTVSQHRVPMGYTPSIVSSDMSIILCAGVSEWRKDKGVGQTCEIGRIGGICCKLGSTGGFLT